MYYLECGVCKKQIENESILCPECGGPIQVYYDYDSLRLSREDFHGRTIWRYRELLPFEKITRLVTLNEGGTPLQRSDIIGDDLALDLWFKLESHNPTGSFKDRGSAVELTKALEKEAKSVVCASTGNMASSVSAYSAKAGLKCRIVVPRNAPVTKITMIKLYGAEVEFVDGGFDEAVDTAMEYAKDPNVLFVGDYYWRREGQKTISLEIWEQLPNVDWIVAPVGSGVLLSALYKGFWELKKLKLIEKIPRMVGVQAEGCSPVTRAWKGGRLQKWEESHTLASAIEVLNAFDAPLALEAARESGGKIISVSDREIMESLVELARREGIFVEPGAAASIAGVMKNWKTFDGRVVCILTGYGLNDFQTVKDYLEGKLKL
ncbi:MAG: threonine synthase [Candidatus Jordarchaeaceae archaeon]